MTTRFLPTLLLPLAVGCVTDPNKEHNGGESSSALLERNGDSIHSPVAQGGALDEFGIRREITSRVLLDGQALPHKEYGQRALIFHQDGRYEARKLHFTQYWMTKANAKHYLVYAEDSWGRYEISKDGMIELKAPEESTCPDREGGGSEKIAVYLQDIPRIEPFRTTQKKESRVTFDTNGWLQEFHGRDYWRGKTLHKADVEWPPYPTDGKKAGVFRFESYYADLHYGCLNKGFAEFRGEEQIYLAEDFRFDEGVNPWHLKPGTRLRTTP